MRFLLTIGMTSAFFLFAGLLRFPSFIRVHREARIIANFITIRDPSNLVQHVGHPELTIGTRDPPFEAIT